MDRIRLFIDELSTEESTPELANVYSPDIPQSEIYAEKICITTFKELKVIILRLC